MGATTPRRTATSRRNATPRRTAALSRADASVRAPRSHSPSPAVTGDRSFVDCRWQVVALLPFSYVAATGTSATGTAGLLRRAAAELVTATAAATTTITTVTLAEAPAPGPVPPPPLPLPLFLQLPLFSVPPPRKLTLPEGTCVLVKTFRTPAPTAAANGSPAPTFGGPVVQSVRVAQGVPIASRRRSGPSFFSCYCL